MAKKQKETRTSNMPVKKGKNAQESNQKMVLTYKIGMTVADVANGMGKTNAQIIMKLMQLGIMATQNQNLMQEARMFLYQ